MCVVVAVGLLSCGGSKQAGSTDAGAPDSAVDMGTDHDAGSSMDVAIEHTASCNDVASIRASGSVWVLKTDGSVWRWGVNPAGQLGDGTMTSALLPIELSGLAGTVVDISPGPQDTFARLSDGTVYAWGNNQDSELAADGQPSSALRPVHVSAVGTDAAELSPGLYHSCARKNDGTLWCWGMNLFGQVGDGTTMQRDTPVQVVPLGSGVAHVSAGDLFTCALKTDSTVWCWGTNANGRLGDGSGADQSSPVQVGALGNQAAAVVIGFDYACALDKAGAVWCWGWNTDGNLGDGTYSDRPTPTKVGGLPVSVTKVSASSDHVCALGADGSLWCWGDNSAGQLGDGTTTPRSVPTAVMGLDQTVTEVAAGSQFTCALKADGSVWCWGSDAHGMLGDGTSGSRPTPAPALGCP
jgi:alpha-tubulin suppressor-like RCC1 family protein